MNAEQRLESLIAAARVRDWPGPVRNSRIEEFIMLQAAQRNGAGRARRAGLLFGIGGLMLAGAVYGANRLYNQIIVHGSVNGVEFVGTVQTDENGIATMLVPTPDGGQCTVIVGAENVEDDGAAHFSLSTGENTGETAAGDGDTVKTVTVTATPEGAVERRTGRVAPKK